MVHGHTVAAVIVAAGASRRMGFDKLAYPLDGGTVLEKSVRAFDTHPAIDEILLVAGENAPQAALLAAACAKPAKTVAGGATRVQSVRAGLDAVNAEYVAIHDAARPFVTPQVIWDALEAAYETGAAAPAVPVKDTVKVAADGFVVETPAREKLYAVQTPQCFRTALYRQVLAQVCCDAVTDDCSAFELAGLPVRLTQGDYANYKITTREDLPAPEKNGGNGMRIGHGYDVHRLVEGRALVLGGVTVPYEKGLLGHSDADVLTHAVMDALLEDRYQLESRMMIQGEAVRDGQTVMCDIALNEIAVTRKDALKALRFKVYVNDDFLNEYSADGILVATPTGSTAYNLSAGGPVIAPGAKMMVLTPICSHALNARSIVLAPEDSVRIDFVNGGQVAAFDGDTFIELEKGDSIRIKRSEMHTIMVKLKQISFMQNLSNHLAGRI